MTYSVRDQEVINLSPILVFALSGKIGSGVSFVRDKLNQELYTYGYDTEIIDVAEMVLVNGYEQYSDDRDAKEITNLSRAERAKELQRRGNYLRERGGNDFIAKVIFFDYIYEELINKNEINKRKAYIIDSLKNPAEATFFRKVFGSAVYLIGVMADGEIRKTRLIERKNYTEEDYNFISSIDEGEQQESWGQNSIATIIEADYFFDNNFDTKDEIAKESERLLRLIFRTGIDTPRVDEEGMNVAFQVSLKSACLSRQVGAAIYSARGEILSTGFNDVPQFLGGLYGFDGSSPDKRCWVYGAKCYNDDEKNKIIDEILGLAHENISNQVEEKDILQNGGEKVVVGVMDDAIRNAFRNALNRSRVRKLLEFSRSIHAEMEAILSVARKGVQGLIGSTLYCTTYPCHNCAKHIVGAGITRVVYLEPYEKSLAIKLHTDSISDASKEKREKRLILDSYKGVAPRRFNQFFSSHGFDRKKQGLFIDNDRRRSALYPVGAQNKIEFKARLEAIFSDATDSKVDGK